MVNHELEITKPSLTKHLMEKPRIGMQSHSTNTNNSAPGQGHRALVQWRDKKAPQ